MRLKLKRYSMQYMGSREETQAVPIAGDAAVATVSVGHGRLIPLVILDTTGRPDLAEVINNQAHFPAGDVVVQWGGLENRPDHVSLFLEFQRPTERSAIIEFGIMKHGILVEHILLSSALYIQAGKMGDRLAHDINVPKMIIEVPDTGFRAHWDKLYRDAVIKYARGEGFNRATSKEIARSYIDKIRSLARFKINKFVA